MRRIVPGIVLSILAIVASQLVGGLMHPAWASGPGTPDSTFNAHFPEYPLKSAPSAVTVHGSSVYTLMTLGFTTELQKFDATTGVEDTAFAVKTDIALSGTSLEGDSTLPVAQDGSIFLNNRGSLIKLTAAGELDSGFTSIPVNAFALDHAGTHVYVVEGNPWSSPPVTDLRVRRLNLDGTEDTGYTSSSLYSLAGNSPSCPGSADAYVDGAYIAVDPSDTSVMMFARLFDDCDGNLFSTVYKKFDSTGDDTPYSTFNTTIATHPPTWDVNGFVMDHAGALLVRGWAGQQLTKFDSSGNLDTTFNGRVNFLNNFVGAIAVLSDDSVLVGGRFDKYLTKFSSAGVQDTTFRDTAYAALGDNEVTALEISGSHVFAGNSGAGHLKKLASDGSVVSLFTDAFDVPVFDDEVWAIAVDDADGSVYVGGRFTGLLKKFTSAGVEVSSFTNNLASSPPPGWVTSITVGSDGSVYVLADDVTAPLRKFSSAGVQSASFTANSANLDINNGNSSANILMSPDGSIMVVGFKRVAGGSMIKKVSPTGIEDTAYTTHVGSLPFANNGNKIAVLPDGSVVYIRIGPSGNCSARKFSATGVEDTSFATNASSHLSGSAQAIASVGDGSVLITGCSGGGWTRYDSDGNFLVGAGFGGQVTMARDGSVLQSYSDHAPELFALDGTEDWTFQAQTGYSVTIPYGSAFTRAITTGPDGSIYIGGTFWGPGMYFAKFEGPVPTNSVWFNGNGYTGGAVPSRGVYSVGSPYTVAGNTGSLVKTGYTFAGWNTSADGTGTAYGPGTAHTTYSTAANLVLYATWTAASSYTVTYDGNGSTSGTVPSATAGSGSVTLATNSGSLAKSGYSFAGWNTLANGGGTPYSPGGSYTLSANATLYAQWTSNSSGGGGSNGGGTGGGSAASDTATWPTTRPAATPVVAAIPPGSNPSIPASGVTPGGSVLLVDGVASRLTIRPDTPVQPKALVASGDGFTLQVAGQGSDGRPLGLTSDAALRLERDSTARVQGTGFAPNADVQVHMFSTPVLLGLIHTDANGAFDGTVVVPRSVDPGHHTLQLDALTTDNRVRSLSLGVVLEAPGSGQRVAKAVVNFPAGSAQLTAKAKKALAVLARSTGGRASGGSVVGFVQRDGNYAKNGKLSLRRARAVARFLHRHGVAAPLMTRGNGALSLNDAARKAVVTVRYAS